MVYGTNMGRTADVTVRILLAPFFINKIEKNKKIHIYTQSIDYRVFLNGGFGNQLESILMLLEDIWRLLLVEKDIKTISFLYNTLGKNYNFI